MNQQVPISASALRRKMSAAEFIKIWKGEYEGVEGYEEFYQRGKQFSPNNFIEYDSGNLYVKFVNYSINEIIDIKNIDHVLSNLVLSNTSLGHLKIEYSKTEDIWIIDNSKITIFTSHDSKLNKIWFDNSLILACIIRYSEISEFLASTIQVQLLYFQFSQINFAEVSLNSYVQEFGCKLNIENKTSIEFYNSTFERLDLGKTNISESSSLKIIDCKSNNLTIENCCNFGSILFSNLSALHEWKAIEKKQNGSASENELENYEFKQVELGEKPPILHLSDSELGNLQFINCDLRSFDHFEFRNAKLLNAFVAGSQMPDANAFRLPGEEQPPALAAEQKRLAFGQFKKIYENQGDQAGALRYLAYEMEAYRKQLKLGKKKLGTWNSKARWDNRWERFILFLNRHSTNYGNSWGRGAVVTLLAIIVAFGGYCLILGYRLGNDFGKFIDLASFAPQYLNPFRDEDSGQFFEILQKDGLDNISGLARLWDYFWRIIIAYLVYQTIQAFRKLGRSSG